MTAGSTPALVIELAVEATPRVRIECVNESEERRIVDWIRAHDGLAELVARALELVDEERAA